MRLILFQQLVTFNELVSKANKNLMDKARVWLAWNALSIVWRFSIRDRRGNTVTEDGRPAQCIALQAQACRATVNEGWKDIMVISSFLKIGILSC